MNFNQSNKNDSGKRGGAQLSDDNNGNHRAAVKKRGSKRPPKKSNPLQAGIQTFLIDHLALPLSSHGLSQEALTSSLPKRYSIYEPLLLLPVNTFSSPVAWCSLYKSLNLDQLQILYASISRTFATMGVTHIAINAPIPLANERGNENRMRSPTGLVPLYGDFGLLPPSNWTDCENEQLSRLDFESAFWVRTVQNGGVVQIWAPLYTMFSRGNITEKARILGQGSQFDGLDDNSLRYQKVQEVSVVDMYAGIGYFVFSYIKRGVKRVWGWEINGWSVEGLRRGCRGNGWGCKVVPVNDEGKTGCSLQQLVDSIEDTDRVVIFHGNNKFAAEILGSIRVILEDRTAWNRVRHVNLGLLPTSQPSWENACKLLDRKYGGWVHVHENVDVQQIEKRKEEIINEFRTMRIAKDGGATISEEVLAGCCHVERVKTYAPGVMHCVFDIEILFQPHLVDPIANKPV
ncbi:S-adenosyl-L-methionine-dependent methyltransferase [Elaphomyces granulatus]